ncbi:hypothetical protein ACHAXT_008788 [Thalassiosira profunda]
MAPTFIPCNTQLRGSISKWNDEYQSADDEEEEELITKEAFMRDMLSEPARRKKKGIEGVQTARQSRRLATPDPYTSPQDMLKEAKETSSAVNKKGGNGKVQKGKSNLVGMDSKYANGIAASIYSRKKDGSLYKVLGSFELDKNTNCGDLLSVGEREFEVVTARSQFKYAGGKRFVMVRKILEVKEVTRIAEENTLKRLMSKETDSPTGKNFE